MERNPKLVPCRCGCLGIQSDTQSEQAAAGTTAGTSCSHQWHSHHRYIAGAESHAVACTTRGACLVSTPRGSSATLGHCARHTLPPASDTHNLQVRSQHGTPPLLFLAARYLGSWCVLYMHAVATAKDTWAAHRLPARACGVGVCQNQQPCEPLRTATAIT